MNEIWQILDDEQIEVLMISFRERIKTNKSKGREYTSLQKVLYELRHEMMKRAQERAEYKRTHSWRDDAKNSGGQE